MKRFRAVHEKLDWADADAALADLAEASSLPPRYYVDAAVYEAERHAIFARSWISVAREEDLENPGDFVTADIAGDAVVVVRGTDGHLRALSNVCLHRSAVIVDGCGNTAALQCPYHLWTFGLDGRLRGAPSMGQANGFDPREQQLPEFRVESWEGWVFVNFDANAAPLHSEIGAFGERLREFDVGTMRRTGSVRFPSPWNWKITVENFSESYHHAGIHADTLQKTFPGQRSWAEDNGGEPWMWLDHVSVSPDREPFAVGIVFPAHLFVLIRPSRMAWFKLQVSGPLHVDLDVELFAPPSEVHDTEAHAEALAAISFINLEDKEINMRTQRGMGSRFARPGRVSHLERGTWQFRRWVAERLRAVS